MVMSTMKPLRLLGWMIIGLMALVLALAWALASGIARKPVEKLASRILERPVSMDELHVYVLRTKPMAHVRGLQVANAAWVEGDAAPQMVALGNGKVAVRLLPLLRGELRFATVQLDNAQVDLRRLADGRANWSFGEPKPASTTPLALPVIEHFAVRNSGIRFDDALSKIKFEGGFETEETADASIQPLKLKGRGELNGQPFKLDLNGGALAGVLAGGSYPFSLDIAHGATTLVAKGTLKDPLTFGDLEATLTLAGRNLADLYYITGLALPVTRDYSLSGKLTRAGTVYDVGNLVGKIGGSDLRGDLRVDVSGAKPLLWADLRSRLLDPADAGVIFGGGDVGAARYLLPDSPLDLTRLRSMDAEVRYRAEAVNVDTLPLKQVDLTMALEDGRLTLAPLAVTLPQGTVSGSLVIDGSKDVPHIIADVRLVGARLEDFAKQAGVPDAVSGPIVARVKLDGHGMSFHEAAGNADGTAAVVVPRGEIRRAFAELVGVSALEGVGLLLSGSDAKATIRCGVLGFDLNDGLMQGKSMVIDTDVSRVQGEGHLNLKDESLDLTFRGQPKSARLVRLLVPVTVGGTLLDPAVSVNPIPVGVQAGAAVALGAVFAPLAAILPFVDLGTTEDADCRALVNETRASMAQGGAATSPTEPNAAPVR
ncbi:MAG: AsmA family protein [Alphaproteobacteria bacterium]|nr:MAG: AsmA family protein [Alphaproteobacteria bacterium]